MEKLLINDIPLRELGCVLAPDSYKSVLTWAKFKSLRSNDWAEYNFAEYDLSKPTLDKRTVTLNFHANGGDGYSRFMEYLMQYVYSFFEFPELGVTLKLRIDTNSLKSIGQKWQSFSITFFDDTPFTKVSPTLSTMNLPDTGYKLDGNDLSLFGIAVLQDSLKSICQIPALKERLVINENSMNGAIYDGEAYPTTDYGLRLKSSSFTLKLLLRAENLIDAVSNYYYLYNILRQSNSRVIYVTQLNKSFHCFYQQCSVSAVHKQLGSGLSGIAFDLTFNSTE